MASITTGTQFFRNGLLLEALANISGGIAMLAMPGTILSYMARPTTPLTTLSTELVQWLGGVVLALTTPLLLAYPNTVGGVAGRWTAYATLGMGEVFLVAIMTYEWWSERSAFKDEALVMGITVLGGTLGWRAFCMLYRPQWIGQLSGSKKTQ